MFKPKLEHHGGIYWVLLEDIPVTLSNGDKYIVHKGMRTDLCSVPQWLWWLFGPYGKFLVASLIHDSLYISDYKRKELGDKEARKFADYQMLYFSNKLNANKLDNYLRYYAVRLFGRKVFKK